MRIDTEDLLHIGSDGVGENFSVVPEVTATALERRQFVTNEDEGNVSSSCLFSLPDAQKPT